MDERIITGDELKEDFMEKENLQYVLLNYMNTIMLHQCYFQIIQLFQRESTFIRT